MKKFLLVLSTIFLCTIAFAQTINVNWKVDDTTYASNTCEYGGTLTVPSTPPTKYGYTFQGWGTYTFLEYIESTGTQYIDTGIVPTLDYTFEIKAIKQVNRSLIGTIRDNLEYTFTGGQVNYLYIGSTRNDLPSTIDNSVPHVWAVRNGKLWCDDVNVNITNIGTVTFTKPFFLFARNYENSLNDSGSHTIYYAKIWDDNGTLVRNFIPAKNSSNVIGMYDTVSDTFFTNAGTGEFIAGPVR